MMSNYSFLQQSLRKSSVENSQKCECKKERVNLMLMMVLQEKMDVAAASRRKTVFPFITKLYKGKWTSSTGNLPRKRRDIIETGVKHQTINQFPNMSLTDSRRFLNKLWQKTILLILNNFCFCHNVFNSVQLLYFLFSEIFHIIC